LPTVSERIRQWLCPSRLLTDALRRRAAASDKMEGLVFHLREEETLATLTQDVIKTSEIEGQKLDTQQVRSSIARRMGIEIAALPQMDRSVEGIVEVMLDATRHRQ
jgi:hypothetical protein